MMLEDLSRWQKIYHTNLLLDDHFHAKYLDCEPMLYEKNCIELLVELGEFINETKCFKYWSIKKPNQEKLLEEFADCITMTLYFYGYLSLELTNIKASIHLDSTNILEVLNYIYSECTKLMHHLDAKLIINILANLIYISKLLSLKEEDILKSIETKQIIIEERLNSDY